jgi:alkylation response protein AidB-like acyl-CoA dehydrogenase
MSLLDEAGDPVEEVLRERLTALLAPRYGVVRAQGDTRSARPDDHLNQSGAESLDAVIELQRLLWENGLVGFAVPRHLGGHGLSGEVDRRLSGELSRFNVPDTTPLAVGLSLVVPTLLAHGSADQQRQYIPRALSTEHIWCQLFSEPSAGSDLASMQTRAVRDGDEWVVNGQKVWTSWGKQADHGILLARTDPAAPKHRGISMLLLDMSTPGVDVQPLREMTGGWQFCQVFFTDVRVPASCLVGDLNNGWAVALTTLSSERSEGSLRAREPQASRLIRLAQARGLSRSRPARQRLAQVWAREHAVTWLGERLLNTPALGRSRSDASLVKVLSSETGQAVAELEVELEGAAGVAWPAEEPSLAQPAFQLAHSRMSSIAGGTNEVQRNIIAERLLGLPREPR